MLEYNPYESRVLRINGTNAVSWDFLAETATALPCRDAINVFVRPRKTSHFTHRKKRFCTNALRTKSPVRIMCFPKNYQCLTAKLN
jgi:hypothetical protein